MIKSLENRDEPFYIRIQAAEEILERGKFKPKKPEEMMGQVDIVSPKLKKNSIIKNQNENLKNWFSINAKFGRAAITVNAAIFV